MKALKKPGTNGADLSMVNSVYDKTYSQSGGGRPKALSLKSEVKQEQTVCPLLVNTVPTFLARAIRQETYIKEVEIRNEKTETISTCRQHDSTIYLNNLTDTTVNVLLLINIFSKIVG